MIRRANEGFRQRDSCAAAGQLISVTASGLAKDKKSLTDSLATKNEKIGKLEKDLSKSKKIAGGSVIVTIILTLVLLL